jgi:RNA polymerase sigma factor for flagellar operon FliA
VPERDGHRGRSAGPTARGADDLWEALQGGVRTDSDTRGVSGAVTGDARERLVAHYAPLVRYVAARVRTGLPAHVDVADLVSAGYVGLLSAIESFDRARGTGFESYAVPRIRGAMLDELRALDWVPRSLRRRAREIDSAMSELSVARGRVPTDIEIAERLGTTPTDLHDSLSQIAFADVIELTGRDEVRDTSAPDPLEEVEEWALRDDVIVAVHRLPVRERIVVALYYWESFTLAQVAEVLDVSESRAAQLHASAVRRLRPWMLDEAS